MIAIDAKSTRAADQHTPPALRTERRRHRAEFCLTPEEYAADIDHKERKWGALVRKLGLKME